MLKKILPIISIVFISGCANFQNEASAFFCAPSTSPEMNNVYDFYFLRNVFPQGESTNSIKAMANSEIARSNKVLNAQDSCVQYALSQKTDYTSPFTGKEIQDITYRSAIIDYKQSIIKESNNLIEENKKEQQDIAKQRKIQKQKALAQELENKKEQQDIAKQREIQKQKALAQELENKKEQQDFAKQQAYYAKMKRDAYNELIAKLGYISKENGYSCFLNEEIRTLIASIREGKVNQNKYDNCVLYTGNADFYYINSIVGNTAFLVNDYTQDQIFLKRKDSDQSFINGMKLSAFNNKFVVYKGIGYYGDTNGYKEQGYIIEFAKMSKSAFDLIDDYKRTNYSKILDSKNV